MLEQGDKKRALLALRRKKYQESLLAKTDAQLDQLEKLANSVEFALIQKDVVFGLQQGTKVLEEIHKEMGGIEHVEKLMGETADAIAYQKVFSTVAMPPCQADHQGMYRFLTFMIPVLGNQRDAGQQHVKPRRRRGGRRASRPGGRGEWRLSITKCPANQSTKGQGPGCSRVYSCEARCRTRSHTGIIRDGGTGTARGRNEVTTFMPYDFLDTFFPLRPHSIHY